MHPEPVNTALTVNRRGDTRVTCPLPTGVQASEQT
jgi:hypothetical protein